MLKKWRVDYVAHLVVQQLLALREERSISPLTALRVLMRFVFDLAFQTTPAVVDKDRLSG